VKPVTLLKLQVADQSTHLLHLLDSYGFEVPCGFVST
jgi:hypothetical protein